MKALDRVLQRWRISKVLPFIPRGGRVLDVGCADGVLYHQHSAIGEYVGMDPEYPPRTLGPRAHTLRGFFPADLPPGPPYDAIVMLAMLEHVPAEALQPLARACAESLRPGGRVLLTVPAPRVDDILDVLKALRLIDGMSLEEHHGYDIAQTRPLFESQGLRTHAHRSFQLGLNHLFVFEKP